MGVNDIFQEVPLDQIVSLADRGDVGACVKVGYRYLHGHAATRDERKAVEYFKKAGSRSAPAMAWLYFIEIACRKKPYAACDGLAKLRTVAATGDATAKTLLGRCYQLGFGGLAKSTDAAEKLYSLAAGEFARAQTHLAEVQIEQHKYAEAIPLLESAIKAGDTRAMRVLAFVYTKKRKTKDRIHTAASLLRQAAKAGDCAAHHELGLVYQNGLCTVSAKPERAFTLFRRSAVTGYRPAQLASAIAYGRGMGTLPSGDAARYWAKRYFASQLQR